MRRSPILQAIIPFFLVYQIGLCHAADPSTSPIFTTITTKTSSTSRTRRITYLPAIKTPSIPPAAHSVIRKVGNGSNDQNCVLYLRQQRGIKLPAQNLTTYASKLSIINSSIPYEKSVAIIKTPGRNAKIGHLAEVTSLEEKDGKITMRLSESNNPNRGYYERTITGKNLGDIQKDANIMGYYVDSSY
jgi:hypothetical protein